MIREKLKAFGLERTPGKIANMIEHEELWSDQELWEELEIAVAILNKLSDVDALSDTEAEFLDTFGEAVKTYWEGDDEIR